MSKTLKLGFAMGGGVSLGSFSGASLTEAIKLAILFGVDKTGLPYEKVEVDVFSGASAGAMSLGIMLKALAFPEQAPGKRNAALAKLEQSYGNDAVNALPVAKRQQLVDAELAQQLMNRIWVDEINIDKLLASDGTDSIPPLKFQAGLCNKAAVTDIAKKYMSAPPAGGYNAAQKPKHPLLASRVVYGCSISNINPIKADALELFPNTDFSQATAKEALVSNFHREQRIFDINFSRIDSDKFDDQDIHPKRWMRFHWGNALQGKTFDIRKNEGWKHIIATAIASGAFPVAFEPVPLQRFKWEYPDSMWEFGDQSSKVFAYMDGGAFTNSPVEEAFKMASHIDSCTNQDPDKFERRVLFVDPFVAGENSFNLGGFRDFKDQKALGWLGNLSSSIDGNDLLMLTSLDKLLPNGLGQFVAVYEQAEAKYRHRTFQVASRLEMRNTFRKLLAGHVKGNSATFNQLRNELSALLSQFSDRALIPTLSASLASEINRLAIEEKNLFAALDDKGEDVAIKPWSGLPSDVREQAMTAMLFSFVDLFASLEAKSRNSQLIAIGPFKIDDQNKMHSIFLPGGPLSGFAGFMSSLPSAYEVKVARYCTYEMMLRAGLIPNTVARPEPNVYPGEFKQQKTFLKEYELGLNRLAERVGQALKSSNFTNLGWFNSLVLGAISSFVESAIKALPYRENKQQFEFRVMVSDKKFELDGSGWADNDRHAIVLRGNDKQRCLVCFASREWDVKNGWSGYFLDKGELPIDRNGWLSINDKEFARVSMPDDALLRQAAKMLNPVFYSKYVLKASKPLTDEQKNDFWQLVDDVKSLTELFAD